MADIPINPVTRRVQFTGNTGTGPFAFTFNILTDSDIVVYKNTTLLTLTTDYTITTNANGTGSITLTAALVLSDVLTIIGGRSLERTTDFVTAGDLLASSLNEQLDSLVIMAQQLDEKAGRALRTNPGDEFTSLELPTKSSRLGTVLGFNATTGDPEAGPNIADVNTLADISADIALLADIEDGTIGSGNYLSNLGPIWEDITLVSANNANVTAVANQLDDIDVIANDIGYSNLNTVAINASSIVTVKQNIADVNTVAGAVFNLNTVSTNIADVNVLADVEDGTNATNGLSTIANNVSGILAVVSNSANITTVAGINTEVTTVAGISSDVTTVAGDTANIGTVATNIANVNSVGSNISNVNTVAGISSDVTTVAADGTDIGTVATNIANVNTVATNINNLTTLSNINSDVSTVAGIASDVTTVAGISANVTTVAGISANVTTVASDSAVINTVATAITDVSTVSADIASVITAANDLNEAVSEIETVAGSIANVDLVGADIANVNTVAGSISNVNTVATDIADVSAVAAEIGVGQDVTVVAANMSDVTTVSGSIANVNTVAGNTTNINTVASNDANITTVAGISGNVTTVAGISSDVTAVAADAADIGAVSTDIANVNTVAGSITNVNIVATNISNVNTVAGISSNVTTVAGISADVTAVAADQADIGTVSTNISDVTTVAGEIGVTGDVTIVAAQLGAGGAVTNVSAAINNVITVSQNLANVNNFAEVYRISATAPTTSLDTGDLWYDTLNTALKVYDGSQWTQGVLSGSGFLPLTGGTMSGDISMAGNDIYTNNGDLQMGTGIIYGNTFSGNATTATKLLALSTNPTNDSIVFFDTSAGNYAYLTIGSNLTLSGTTLSANTQSPTAGAGITVSGTQVNHADTSSQASVNNSDGTVIQDITIDTFGHITGIQSNNLDNRFLRSDTSDSMSGALTITGNASYVGNWGYSTLVLQDSGGYPGIDFRFGSNDWLQRMESGGSMQWAYRSGGNYSERMELTTAGVLTLNGNTVWHAGNDGSGSGLDADTVDGYHANTSQSSNTVAVRSSSGYLFSSYFNGTGTFATSGNSSGMVNFTGTNGVDTYGRSYNGTAARAAMNLSTTDNVTFGNVTATAFYGDGSNLTNLPGGTASNTYQVGAHWIYTNSTQGSPTGWDTDGNGGVSSGDASNLWQFGDAVPLTASNRGLIAIDDLNSGDIIGGLEWVNNDFISQVVRGNSGFNSRWISKGRENSSSTDQHYGALVMDGYFGLTYTHSSWNWTGSANMAGEQVFYANNSGITATAFNVASDIRLKENLVVIPDAIDKVSQLNGYSYTTIDNGTPKYGVVAQEVEVVMPHSVQHRLDVPDTPEEDLIKTVDYPSLIPLLIEAIKEQQSTIEALEARITALEG